MQNPVSSVQGARASSELGTCGEHAFGCAGFAEPFRKIIHSVFARYLKFN